MLEWFVSSAVLTAVLIALRALLRGRLSPKLQYALWLLALVRLLVPVSVGKTAVSVGNLLPQDAPAVRTEQTADAQSAPAQVPRQSPAQTVTAPQTAETPAKRPADVRTVLKAVWLTGAVLTGGWFVFCNLRFGRRLKRSVLRSIPAEPGRPEVRLAAEAASPCLFGLFPPVIYVTEACAQDAQLLHHCAEHELTHYLHRDHIWAALRGVCLALHWFDPFVWWAAALARTDAELACDEDTIRRLGEAERAEYGRSLIRMTCRTRVDPLCAATTMSGRGGQLKTRIVSITKQTKTAVPALICVLVLAILAAGCTMTGARDEAEPVRQEQSAAPDEPEQAEPEPEPAADEAEPAGTDVVFTSEKDAAALAVPEAYAAGIVPDDSFTLHSDAADSDYVFSDLVLFSFYDRAQQEPYPGLVWAILRYPPETAEKFANERGTERELCAMMNHRALGSGQDAVYALFCIGSSYAAGTQFDADSREAAQSYYQCASDGIAILREFVSRNELTPIPGALDWEEWYRKNILTPLGQLASGTVTPSESLRIDNCLARAVVLSSYEMWAAFSLLDEKTQSAALDSLRTYLLEHYDALEALGVFRQNAEELWLLRKSYGGEWVWLTLPVKGCEPCYILTYTVETDRTDDAGGRIVLAMIEADAQMQQTLTEWHEKHETDPDFHMPDDLIGRYLRQHIQEMDALGIWSDDTVWTVTMPDEVFTLTISGLPDGQRLQISVDPETYAVSVSD